MVQRNTYHTLESIYQVGRFGLYKKSIASTNLSTVEVLIWLWDVELLIPGSHQALVHCSVFTVAHTHSAVLCQIRFTSIISLDSHAKPIALFLKMEIW